jgi:hypothetical protein
VTPGGTPQGPPRSADGPSAGGFLAGVLAALWFSPVTLAVWLVSGYVIARQRRWHWHRVALGALVVIAAVVAVSGPWDALLRHFFVASHFLAVRRPHARVRRRGLPRHPGRPCS